jgi:small subunit ribosomal protein S4e
MHLTRIESTKKLPITRKGEKYLARPLLSTEDSVSVSLALRNMLKLVKTTKELKQLIHEKALKINGRLVKDYRDSIKLFSVFEAGNKAYRLSILPTKKFILEESHDKKRLCKVIGKKLISGNKIQINLHDGTNFISKDKINTNDTFYLDTSGKILSHIPFEKAKEVFVMSGTYTGLTGKVQSAKNKKLTLKFKDKEDAVELDAKHLIALQ